MKLHVNAAGDKAVRAQLLRLVTSARLALDATAEQVEEQVEDQAGKHTKPGGTGALFRSVFKARVPDGWEIGHDLQVAPHARFVHRGTKPHVIKPKNKTALRWGAGGRYFFARGVKHPGYQGDAWLPRAAAQAPRIFAQQIAARLKD